VEAKRGEAKAATAIQNKQRGKLAIKKVDAKRNDAKAATAIQNKQRAKLAKRKVGEKRTDAKAATAIQNKHRQKQAKEVVNAKRAEQAKGNNNVELVDAQPSVQSSLGGDDYDDEDFDSTLSTSADSMEPTNSLNLT